MTAGSAAPVPIAPVQRAVRACKRCWLAEADHCAGPIPYSGPANPGLVIVGEAPGDKENTAGVPFIGPAGQELRQMLRDAVIRPDTVGYMNTVACYPGKKKAGGYRKPKPEEVAACRPNVLMQLAALQPDVVVLAGGVALQAVRPDLMISKDRGRPMVVPGYGQVIVPTYHPSAVLRAKHLRHEVIRDLRQARWRWRSRRYTDRWPETCRLCHGHSGEAIVYDEHGVCWCKRHVREPEKPTEQMVLV